MNKDYTAGASPEGLARFLAMGAGDDADDDDAEASLGAFLGKLLSTPLSLDDRRPDSLPTVLGMPYREMQAHIGRMLREVLLDANVETTVLTTLKDYAKARVKAATHPSEHTAATAVYYAAIASGVVFHRRNISSLSSQQLDKGFANLAGKSWMNPEMKDLFEKARDAL